MVSWFTRDELRLAFGITVSFPRLGEALNSVITPQFYEINHSLFLPFFVGLLIQTISLVSGFILVLLDRRGEDKKPPKPENVQGEKFTIEALKNLKMSYWLLLVICGFGEVLFLAFMFDINEYYQVRFGYNLTTAGDLIAIPYGIAAITTLVLGWYSKYIFRPRKSLILGSLIYCFTYLLFSFLPQCIHGCSVSFVPIIGLGFCFGVFSVLFMPSIEEVIENKKIVGTGYGLVAIFQNLLLSVLPILTGMIYGDDKKESIEQENGKFVEISKIYFLIR